MRTTHLISLLVGLVVGGLVGYGLADRAPPSRAVTGGDGTAAESGRTVRPQQPGIGARNDGDGSARAKQSDAPLREADGEARGEPRVVQDAAKGVLVVDPGRAEPDGVDNLSIECRDMRGGEASESLDEGEDGLYRIEAYAGTYTLTWYEEDRTRGMRVRIRAGDTTIVRLPGASDPAPVAHVPAGFGRLEVRLVGADGEPVKYASVRVIGRGISEPEEIDLDTEADGDAYVELLPGTYVVRIGCLSKTVTVRDGQATQCVCDHVTAGEVRLTPGFPGRVSLRAPKDLGENETYAIHLGDWRHRTVAYVRPGTYTYALLLNGHSGQYWDAGTVFVRPGRITLIDPPIPTGSFELTVEVPKAPNVQPWTPADASLLLAGEWVVAKVRLRGTPTPKVFRGTALRLPPGDWELRIDDAGHNKIRERVSIGPGKTSLRVRLRPKQ